MKRFESLADVTNEVTATRIIKEATSPQEFALQVYQQAMDLLDRDSGMTAARLRKNCRAQWPQTPNLKQTLQDAVGTMLSTGCIELLAIKSLQYGAANFDPFRVAMRLFPYWDFKGTNAECRKVGLIAWLDAMSVYDLDKDATSEITASGCGIITIDDAASVYADRTRDEPGARDVIEELSELRETGWADDAPSRNFGDTSDPLNRSDEASDNEDALGQIMDPFEDRLEELKEDFDIHASLGAIDGLSELVAKGLDALLDKKQITQETHAQQLEFANRKIINLREQLTIQASKSPAAY